PVLAPFRLYNADDHLRAVDVARSEPDNLAGTQPATIAEGEHHLIPEAARHVEQSLRLVRAHSEGELLRLGQVGGSGRGIVRPQRDAEQELDPGHDPIAIDDAVAGFDQVQLEAAHVISGGRVGGALQIRRKQLAAVYVAALRMVPEVARGHVLDHALTQRANRVSCTHGEYPPV